MKLYQYILQQSYKYIFERTRINDTTNSCGNAVLAALYWQRCTGNAVLATLYWQRCTGNAVSTTALA